MTVKLKPQATLVGLGRLNLGLIGMVFCNAGFNIIGVNLTRPEDSQEERERSRKKVDVLTKKGYFLVRVIGGGGPQHYKIEEAIVFDEQQTESSESKKAIEAAAHSEVIVSAIGTGKSAQERWVQFMLSVLKHRIVRNIKSDLDVCAADNPVGRVFATTLLRNRFLDTIADDPECDRLLEHLRFYVRFPLMLADRICSDLSVTSDVTVLTENYASLRCSENSRFKHVADADANRGIVTVDSSTLDIHRMLKLSTFSCAHAMAAYLGSQTKGCETIDQAVAHSDIGFWIKEALDHVTESHFLRAGLTLQVVGDYKERIMPRIREPALKDALVRVAYEPKRKLKRDDRLGGAALLTLYNHVKVSDPLAQGIAAGLAYAYHYAPRTGERSDTEAIELGTELRKSSVEDVLRTSCGIGAGAEFGSNGAIERLLIRRVEEFCKLFF